VGRDLHFPLLAAHLMRDPIDRVLVAVLVNGGDEPVILQACPTPFFRQGKHVKIFLHNCSDKQYHANTNR
jgi:hypothetical protein